MNEHYSHNYIFTVNPTQTEIIDIVRAVIKGTGFSLRVRGRNPNRKQFYDKFPNRGRNQRDPETGVWSHTQRGGLQQDLPLDLATSFALYLRPSNWNVKNDTEKVKNEIFARTKQYLMVWI